MIPPVPTVPNALGTLEATSAVGRRESVPLSRCPKHPSPEHCRTCSSPAVLRDRERCVPRYSRRDSRIVGQLAGRLRRVRTHLSHTPLGQMGQLQAAQVAVSDE